MAAPVELPPYVSGRSYEVLAHLARYRFLTAAQILRLGVGENIHQVYDLVRSLETKRLIKRRRNDRLKREPDIIYLTTAGGSLVDNDGFPIDIPSTVNITGEIWHRMAIIDAHIALQLWADAQAWFVDWVKTDFTRSGKLRLKATTTPLPDAPPYVPDAIAQVTGNDDRPRLFVVEVYWRGRDGLHHFRRKIDKVLSAATTHAVEKHNGFSPKDGGARYLVIFMDAATRISACKGLTDPSNSKWRQFYFADHPALLADFAGCWHDATGKSRSLLVAQ